MADVEEKCEWMCVCVCVLCVETAPSVQGLAWWGSEVDRQMQLATYLRARIRERTGFQLVMEVCL